MNVLDKFLRRFLTRFNRKLRWDCFVHDCHLATRIVTRFCGKLFSHIPHVIRNGITGHRSIPSLQKGCIIRAREFQSSILRRIKLQKACILFFLRTYYHPFRPASSRALPKKWTPVHTRTIFLVLFVKNQSQFISEIKSYLYIIIFSETSE